LQVSAFVGEQLPGNALTQLLSSFDETTGDVSVDVHERTASERAERVALPPECDEFDS
jgi:hypothetical protein